MSWPKISIVTPSFNDSRFLERTILSVLSQEYPNLEYIIIDGGSTDGSVGIIKKYAHQLAYWTSEPDKGMYFALQKGFAKCTGEVMGWINSDDKLHGGSLFTIGQIFGDYPAVQWLQGMPNVIDEEDRVVLLLPACGVDKLFFYQKKHVTASKYIQQESTCWRRELWNKAGGYISTEYKYAGDFELWIRFFHHAKLFNIDALTGSFRLSRSGQASTENKSAYIQETLEILNHFPLAEAEKKFINKTLWFQKADRLFQKVRSRALNKSFYDHGVQNHKFFFNHKLQKFDFNE